MRRHLDEFADLLASMTQTSPVDQSLHHVYDVAVMLEQTQSVLAELLLELSQAAADRIPAQHTGIYLLHFAASNNREPFRWDRIRSDSSLKLGTHYITFVFNVIKFYISCFSSITPLLYCLLCYHLW